MKKLLLVILFFCLVMLVFLLGQRFFIVGNPQLGELLPEMSKLIEKKIFTPPPLVFKDGKISGAVLSRAGVIEWTNKQRQDFGLENLQENSLLNKMAEHKVNDMLENQYFAHNSLDNKGVADLANDFNYQFFLVGENLALGNFPSDEKLVVAWMESPGHRDNILKSGYQEIGVAVKKGMFEGQEVWIAVQHFGSPLSLCDKPSEDLKTLIDRKKEELDLLAKDIEILQSEIRVFRPKKGQEYALKIEEYNQKVEVYNTALMETENIIKQFNEQVLLFNQCIEQYQ